MFRSATILTVVFYSIFFSSSISAKGGGCDLNTNSASAPLVSGPSSSGQNDAEENSGTPTTLAGCGDTTTPPTTPSSITAVSTSTSGNHTISWGASTGFTGLGKKYYLYESVSGGTYSQIAGISYTSTSYAISGKADGNYQYAVEACNLDQCSGWRTASNTSLVRKKPSTPAEPNPTTTTDTGSVTVSWTSVSSATYYVIQRRVNGGSWSTASSNATGSSKSLSGFTDGSWDFRIKACNGYSWACSSYSTDGSSVTWRAKPVTPATPSRPSTSTGSAAISWTKPSGTVTYYDLQKRLNNAGSWMTGSNGVTTTSKTLTGLTDGLWDFRVRACNGYGWACSGYSAISSDTNVKLKPSVPAAMANINDTNGNFSLSWTLPSGSVTYYSVQERVAGGSWVTLVSNTSATSYTRSGLSNNTNYEYRVKACNTASWACSNYSTANSVKIRFKPSTPAKPGNIDSTSTGFTVSWSKPSGTVSFYSLQERVAGGSWSTIASSTSATSKAISSKVNGTNYEYRVRACNSYTWACSSYGSANSVKVRLKPSSPAAPSRPSTSTGSAAINWTKPSGNVSYYDLQKRLDNAGSWMTGKYGDTDTSETLTGLTEGLWDFRVRACNGYSWACSGYSSASSDTDVKLKPSAPVAIDDINTTSSSLALSWVKPSGTVNYYSIRYREVGGSWAYAISDTGSTATTFTHTGRSNNTDYEYKVRACNASWSCSGYSAVNLVKVRFKPSSPAKPGDVNSSATGFSVSWSKPSGTVTYYSLQERVAGESWSTIVSNTAATSQDISGKVNGTNYEYRVRACNAYSWACSAYGSVNSAKVRLKPSIPAAPTRPSTSTGSAAISWTQPSGNISYYDLQKRLNNAGSWLTGKLADTNTSETLSGLTDGLWDFRVRACNDYSWACSGYSAISSDTTVRLKPSVPASPSGNPATNTSGTYSINWVKPSGTVTVYDVQERNNGSWNTAANDTTATTLTLSDNASGDYDYRVRACNQYSWACSSYSGVTSDTQVRKIPTSPNITTPSSSDNETGQYSVTWGSVSEATYYQLQQQLDGSEWSDISPNQEETSFDVNVTNNGFYEYRVRGCNEFSWACSGYSSIKSVAVSLAPNFAFKTNILVNDAPLVEPSKADNDNVGSVKASGGVSGGSASYSIPISMPPGRAGMQPSVSLNYSSRGGNGIAGVGWSLSAGSSISRCGATYAQDGFTGGIKFNATTDKLCLDGQRLMVTSGTYGSSGAQYRTELDSFVRVKQTGSINGISTAFTVEYNSGLVKHYGISDGYGAEVVPSGQSNTLSWMINKEEKNAGNNTIVYQYDTDIAKAEVVLSKIFYTGDSATAGDREVSFEYRNDRPDTNSSYLAGGKIRQTKLLSKIRTFYNAQQVSSYHLYFAVNDGAGIDNSNASERTLLRSIKSCGMTDSDCLNSTEFDWQEGKTQYNIELLADANDNPLWAYEPNEDGAADIYRFMPHGDRNGDGVRDWPNVFVDAEGNSTPHSLNLGLCAYSQVSKSRICVDGDYDLNGTTDGWRINNGLLEIGYSVKNGSNIEVEWHGTNVPMDPSAQINDDVNNTADFNGDGWTDLIIVRKVSETTKAYVYFNTQNRSSPFAQNSYQEIYSTSSTSGASFQLMGDLDGNGLPDLTLSIKSPEYVKPYVSKMILTSLVDNSINFNSYDIDFFHGEFTQFSMFFDVNGDGLQDLLGWDGQVNGAQNLHLRINLGNGQFSSDIDLGVNSLLPSRRFKSAVPGQPGEWTFQSAPKFTDSFKVMDIDGDGQSELLMPSDESTDVLVNGCVQALHLNVLTNFCGGSVYSDTENLSQGETVYSPISSDFDYSIYKYIALTFSEDASGNIVTEIMDTAATNLIGGAAGSTQVVDVYGKGLPDLLFAMGCGDPADDGFGVPCSVSPTDEFANSALAGLAFEQVYQNRNYGSATSIANSSDFEARDMLVKATNGMGVESRWTYLPLSSTQNTDSSARPASEYPIAVSASKLYRMTDQETSADGDAQFAFASSMYVVSEFNQSNGIGDELNATTYQYRGAVYNAEGRGFQGFRQIIVDSPSQIDDNNNVTERLRSTTNFHQEFPLAGQIKSAYTCLASGGDESCQQAPLSESQAGYHISSPTSETFWAFPAKSVNKTFTLKSIGGVHSTASTTSTSFVGDVDPGTISRDMNISSSAFDTYGNIKVSTHIVDSGFGVSESKTVKSFNYDNVNSDWWVQLDSSVVTTRSLNSNWSIYDASLDADKSITTLINTYDTNSRAPSDVTINPNEGKSTNTVTIYNNYGLPSKITIIADGESRTVDTTYNTDNYFVYEVISQIGKITTSTDAKTGQPEWVEDMNGWVTNHDYDGFGRLEKSTTSGVPSAYSRTYWCSGCDGVTEGAFKEVIYAAGAPETTVYKDKLGRALVTKTQKFDAADVFVNVTYDRLGHTLFESVPAESATSTVGTYNTGYDQIGRLTDKYSNVTEGADLSVNYVHGVSAQGGEGPYRTQVIVNSERTLYRTYNGVGQLMSTTDAISGVTLYAYDGQGNPIVLQDANGAKIKASYNALGQKKSVDDPNMGVKSFTYTGFGEVETETDARLNVTTYGYDFVGRLTNRNVLGQDETSSATFIFDQEGGADDKCVGLPSREYKDLGNEFAKSYHYNARCQLVSVRTSIDGLPSFNVDTQYDGNFGRPIAVTYPNDFKVAYEYTTQGHLKRVYNPANDYTYRDVTAVDEQGQWTAATYANTNASISREYYKETGQLKSSSWFGGGTLQQQVQYGYENYGNLQTQTVDNYWDNVTSNTTENYFFDDMHRLTSSNLTINGQSAGAVNYGYDAVGNIKKKSDFSQNSAGAYSYPLVSATRSASNGWAGPNAVRSVTLSDNSTRTYSYNENGNLTGDGIRSIQYNAFNKPVSINVSSAKITPLDNQLTGSSEANLFYGSDQLRYKQTKEINGAMSTHIYIGKLYEQVTKKDADDNLISIENKSYVDDIAVLVENINSNNVKNYNVSYFHRDRLGSMIAETDELGSIRKGYSFDAFGRPRDIDLADKSPLTILAGYSTNRGFTDHEHLDESQLIHMNGRVYDYNLGRFLSVDPFIQDPGNSQSMNPYTYIMNNPLAGTDPSGYFSEALSFNFWLDGPHQLEGSNVEDDNGETGSQQGSTSSTDSQSTEIGSYLDTNSNRTHNLGNQVIGGREFTVTGSFDHNPTTGDLSSLPDTNSTTDLIRSGLNSNASGTITGTQLLWWENKPYIGAVYRDFGNMVGYGISLLPGTDNQAKNIYNGAWLSQGDVNRAAKDLIITAVSAGQSTMLRSATTLANPVPTTLARVVPGNVVPKTLGKTDDVFVTSADALKGLNAKQIADKLTIPPPSSSGFKVIEFPSSNVSGLASPISRTSPGFIQGGRTVGGAPEFVIPNGLIPAEATIRVVQ